MQMKMFLAGFVMAMVVGCASLSQHSETMNLAIQIGVMKVIEVDGDNVRARAEKVREIAADAQTFLDMDGISVSLLASAIDARLADLDLAPSDRLLARALAESIVAELETRVGAGVLSPEQRVTVTQVLKSVETAASFYL